MAYDNAMPTPCKETRQTGNGVQNKPRVYRGPQRPFGRAGRYLGLPVIGIAQPLMINAASDARKSMTSAIGAGGVHDVVSASGMAARFCGVSMIVGMTQQ